MARTLGKLLEGTCSMPLIVHVMVYSAISNSGSGELVGNLNKINVPDLMQVKNLPLQTTAPE